MENHITHIDYMWLDMEGAELIALKSSSRILSTVKVISTEVNFKEYRKGMALFEEFNSFLLNSGFILHKIWGTYGQATAIYIRK